MRTTLTLDSDVAALLAKEQRKRRASLKEIVNDALRRGLREPGASGRSRKRFRTGTLEGGRCLLPGIESVSETLAIIEGDDRK